MSVSRCLIGLALVWTWSLPAGVQATLAATTANAANRYSTTALYSPTGLSATTQGHSVALSWTAAQPNGNGNGNGYAISAVNIGTNAATICPTSSASYMTFITGATGTSATNSSATATDPQGSYVCHLVQTGYNPAGAPPWASPPTWTSIDTLATAKTQIGFVASSAQFANGGSSGVLDANDTFVITFDQPATQTDFSGLTVCAAVSANTIYVAQSGALVPCGATSSVGTFTDGTLSTALSLDTRYNATYAWSNGGRTLTVTIGLIAVGTSASVSGTWRLTPASSILSATGGFAICTADPVGGLCRPTVSGSV